MTILSRQDVVPSLSFYPHKFTVPRNPRIRFSDEERGLVLKLAGEGHVSVNEITRLLNKPWHSTRKLFLQLDIPVSHLKLIRVGAVIGNVTVIENHHHVIERGVRKAACLVHCACGNDKIISNHKLKAGGTRSCGCGMRERKLDSEWNRILCGIRRNAELRNIKFHLTVQHVKFIGMMNCAYCGIEPSNIHRPKFRVTGDRELRISREGIFIKYSGVDRLDSSLGYFPGNVLPCCKFCNYAKMDYTLDEFLNQLARFGSTIKAASILASAESLGKHLIQVRA